MPKGEIIRLFKECTKPKEQGKPTKKNVVSGNNNVIVMDSKSVNITAEFTIQVQQKKKYSSTRI